jgi:hypothetical protein
MKSEEHLPRKIGDNTGRPVKRTIQFGIIALAALLVSEPVLADAFCTPQTTPDCHRMAACCDAGETPSMGPAASSSQQLYSASAWVDVMGCDPEECDRPSPQAIAWLSNSAKTNQVVLAPTEPCAEVVLSQRLAPSSFPSSAHAPPRYLLFHVIRI